MDHIEDDTVVQEMEVRSQDEESQKDYLEGFAAKDRLELDLIDLEKERLKSKMSEYRE